MEHVEPLFSSETLAAAVSRLAEEIVADSHGRPLLLLGILKGALFFTADLARAIGAMLDVTLDFLVVSSYGGQRHSSGEVRLVKDSGEPIAGKHVLIVEDIIDNGHTLAYLRRLLLGRQPASLRSCVMLDKPHRRLVEVPVEYKGLVCPDTFVVGYGLDYQERFRNLPYIGTLRGEEETGTTQ